MKKPDKNSCSKNRLQEPNLTNLTCLQPGARLRFAKKGENGDVDSTLSWDLHDGIEYGAFIFLAWDGSEPIGTKELADGTYSLGIISTNLPAVC